MIIPDEEKYEYGAFLDQPSRGKDLLTRIYTFRVTRVK